MMSRALGRKDYDAVRKSSAFGVYCTILSGLLFSLIYFLMSGGIVRMLGADESTSEATRQYLFWTVGCGAIPATLNVVMAYLIRAEGESVNASIGTMSGCFLNMVLDPFFVLPRFLGMGAAGAGLATALAAMFSTLYFAVYLFRQRKQSALSFRPALLRGNLRHVRPILAVGLPSALQFGLAVIAVGGQTNFVSKYGAEAMAALGITKKLDQLPLYFAQGTASGLLPLLAYNYASGNQERRRSAFRFGCGIAFGFSVLCLVVYELFAPQLTGIFIKDALTIEYGAAFLRRMVVAMPLMSIGYCSTVHFQAMSHAREALVIIMIRKGLLDIPLLWLMDSIYPLYGCMWVQPIVDFIAVLTILFFNRRIRRREGL